MMFHRKTTLLWLLLAGIALTASGCIFSPDDDDGDGPAPEPIPYVPATTELLLMDNFKLSYVEQDIDGYTDMLDDRFKFFFLDANDGFWEKADDIISTENMFSGEARTNSEGDLTKAINSIQVDRLDLADPWRAVSAADPYYGSIPGVTEALYDIKWVLYHNDNGVNSTITVESQQTFYAVPVVEDQGNGTTRTIWKLIGQKDRP